MRIKGLFAVIEVNGDDIINRDISGWFFDNYNDAMDCAGNLNALNDSKDDPRTFVIITLLPGKKN